VLRGSDCLEGNTAVLVLAGPHAAVSWGAFEKLERTRVCTHTQVSSEHLCCYPTPGKALQPESTLIQEVVCAVPASLASEQSPALPIHRRKHDMDTMLL
jgi:hypothetical protein